MAGSPKKRARREAQKRAEEAALAASQKHDDDLVASFVDAGHSPVQATFMRDGFRQLATMRAVRAEEEGTTDDASDATPHEGGAVEALTPSTWREDFLFVLERCPNLSIQACASLVPVTTSRIYRHRTKDPELDAAMKRHLAAFFEEEALTGKRDLPPQTVNLGLKSFAGWVERLDVRVSEGDVETIMLIFMEAVVRATPDRKLMGRIKEELEKLLAVAAAGGDPLNLTPGQEAAKVVDVEATA